VQRLGLLFEGMVLWCQQQQEVLMDLYWEGQLVLEKQQLLLVLLAVQQSFDGCSQ